MVDDDFVSVADGSSSIVFACCVYLVDGGV